MTIYLFLLMVLTVFVLLVAYVSFRYILLPELENMENERMASLLKARGEKPGVDVR